MLPHNVLQPLSHTSSDSLQQVADLFLSVGNPSVSFASGAFMQCHLLKFQAKLLTALFFFCSPKQII